MADREKVIKGLECCKYSSKSHCDGCPYCFEGLCATNNCTEDLASDALALLTEQESTLNRLRSTMEGMVRCNAPEEVSYLLRQMERNESC